MLAPSSLFPRFWQRFVFCEHQNSMLCKTRVPRHSQVPDFWPDVQEMCMHLLATSPLKCYTIKAHVSVSSHLHCTRQTCPALTLHGRKSRAMAKMHLFFVPEPGCRQRAAMLG